MKEFDAKIVYSIISNQDDNYLEQLIVSVMSLRKHMEDAYVVVLMDSDTKQSLVGNRKIVEKLVNQIIVVDVPENYNNKTRSRYLKTTLRNNVDGDFLFIDTDTVICDSFVRIHTEKSIAAVKDIHELLSVRKPDWSFYSYAKKMGYHVINRDEYFNSGVIYVKDDIVARQFYTNWHRLWKKNLNILVNDQPGFNEVNYLMGNVIEELNGIWNCQIVNMNKAILYLADAKIIHYYASNINNKIYDLDRNMLLEVKKGNLDVVRPIIEYPCRAFNTVNVRIISDEDSSIMKSRHYALMRQIIRHIPCLFNANEKIFVLLWHLKIAVLKIKAKNTLCKDHR